jgi:hypothetical protein
MVKLYLLVAVAFATASANAQDAREATAAVQNRASVFQGAQSVCKYLYLSNSDLASSLVKATRASLSDVCECAAMLVVAARSDEQLAALIAAKNMGSVLQSDIKDRVMECMRD